MNYPVILKYSSTDKCYIVSVPDLPGCMADGRDRLSISVPFLH